MRRREYEHAGAEHAVTLRDAGGHVIEATVSGAGPDRVIAFVPTDLGGGRYLLRVGDDVHDVTVERDAAGALRVRLPQGTVRLERLDPFRDTVRAGKGGGGMRRILAPIPGRVLDVLVAPGDAVVAGQPVVIVEAMKMANELRAPIAGRVLSVAASKGAPVEAGAVLAVIQG